MSSMARALYYGLQPALLIGALAVIASGRLTETIVVVWALALQLVLGLLERWRPARTDWLVPARPLAGLVLCFLVLGALIGVVGEAYRAALAEPLEAMRASIGLDVWPHDWPMAIQALLIFFTSELVWYWLHRAEHRWTLVWRASGHGAHHAFKRLGALNGGLNHPFELLLLVAPSVVLGLVFGAGEAAIGAGLLTTTQATIAHTNVDLNHRVIGWLFTTNRFHIHHHSVVLAESNTNYGCAAIVWDRLFGTFEDASTRETGTGTTDPSLWRKLLMPFVEPPDTATAPGGRTSTSAPTGP